MSTVLNPVQCYINTFAGKGASGVSAFVTFSFSNTSGFDAEIPIRVLSPNTVQLSAGAEVYVFRSEDGGATYETELTLWEAFPIPSNALGTPVQKKALLVPNGQYYVGVLVGGGCSSTWSVDFGATCRLITALIAV